MQCVILVSSAAAAADECSIFNVTVWMATNPLYYSALQLSAAENTQRHLPFSLVNVFCQFWTKVRYYTNG